MAIIHSDTVENSNSFYEFLSELNLEYDLESWIRAEL